METKNNYVLEYKVLDLSGAVMMEGMLKSKVEINIPDLDLGLEAFFMERFHNYGSIKIRIYEKVSF
jgi:hypothetical protein